MNIIKRLRAIGFNVRVIRGKPYLDGNRVDAIIDQVLVRFVRGRFTGRCATHTACWAEAYVAGWFSLGNLKAPTPSRRYAEVASILESLRVNSI
jgi:hypothetical protein